MPSKQDLPGLGAIDRLPTLRPGRRGVPFLLLRYSGRRLVVVRRLC